MQPQWQVTTPPPWFPKNHLATYPDQEQQHDYRVFLTLPKGEERTRFIQDLHYRNAEAYADPTERPLKRAAPESPEPVSAPVSARAPSYVLTPKQANLKVFVALYMETLARYNDATIVDMRVVYESWLRDLEAGAHKSNAPSLCE